jgi:hypothetical protein
LLRTLEAPKQDQTEQDPSLSSFLRSLYLCQGVLELELLKQAGMQSSVNLTSLEIEKIDVGKLLTMQYFSYHHPQDLQFRNTHD